jgi:hypothetical protein
VPSVSAIILSHGGVGRPSSLTGSIDNLPIALVVARAKALRRYDEFVTNERVTSSPSRSAAEANRSA